MRRAGLRVCPINSTPDMFAWQIAPKLWTHTHHTKPPMSATGLPVGLNKGYLVEARPADKNRASLRKGVRGPRVPCPGAPWRASSPTSMRPCCVWPCEGFTPSSRAAGRGNDLLNYTIF